CWHQGCMTTALVSANLLTLVISWFGEAAFTYTLQTSLDLLHWHTLPFVISGQGEREFFTFDKEGPKAFARLRYSADGDTNENGLPDLWEWERFGYVDVEPEADADNDGRDNYTEWLQGTDPLDFYDGETPVIRLACGGSWIVPAGQASQQQLYLTVFRPNGEPWDSAPVTVLAASGEDRLLGEDGVSAVLVLWTDENGRIDPEVAPIRFIAPSQAGITDAIALQAGRGRAEVTVRSVGSGFGPPPRQLLQTVEPAGESVVSWSGPIDGASHFLLQQQQANGLWEDLAHIPVEELPPADPETGRYSLILVPPAG
ncbi:MAG: hypothetical protein AB3N33_05365, partial [Puniceicoccaceae bacterium]